MNQNPIVQTIMDKAVRPMLEKQARTVEGVVSYVNYRDQMLDIVYFEPGAQVRRFRKNVPFPKESDGVIGQTIKTGNRVELSFRDNSYQKPYVSKVYKEFQEDHLQVKKGRNLPFHTDLF